MAKISNVAAGFDWLTSEAKISGTPDLNVTRQREVRLRLNSRESQDSIRSLPPL